MISKCFSQEPSDSNSYAVIKIRSETDPKESIFKEISVGMKFGPATTYFKGLHLVSDRYIDYVDNYYYSTMFPGSWGIVNIESTPKLFFYPSLYVNFTNNKIFSFQAELNYLKESFKNNITVTGKMMNHSWTIEDYSYNYQEQIDLKYLETPLLFKIKAYKIKAEPYFSFGIAPLILLKNERKTAVNYFQTSPEIVDSLKNYNKYIEGKKSVSNYQMGLNVLVAVGNHLYLSKKLKLNFEARYGYNLFSNVRFNFDLNSNYLYSRSLYFTLGLQYNLNFENQKVPKLDKAYIKKRKEHFEKVYQNTFFLHHLLIQASFSKPQSRAIKNSGEDVISSKNGFSATINVSHVKTISSHFGFETGLSFGNTEYFYKEWKMEKESKGFVFPFGALKAGMFYHTNLNRRLKFFTTVGLQGSTYFECPLNYKDAYFHRTVNGSNPYDAIVLKNNYSRYLFSTYQKAGVFYKLKNYHVIHLNLISNFNITNYRIGDYTYYSSKGPDGNGKINAKNFSIGIEAGFSLLNFLRFAK